MIRFNKSSLDSNFIKYLLTETPLPVLDTVSTYSYIVSDCRYIHKSYVIKCTKSGYLLDTEQSADYWVSADDGNSAVAAEYSVVDNFLFQKPTASVSNTFVSRSSMYDSETHKRLGKYLRCIRDIYDVDLLPFYNCNSGETTDSFYIDTTTDKYIINRENDKYTVHLIPILFNRDYTIAVDGDNGVALCPVLINDTGLITKTVGKTDYLSYDINKPQVTKYCTFSKPFLYRIDNDSIKLQSMQKYLYLAIQTPKNTNRNIVVIEGDYTHNTGYTVDGRTYATRTYLDYNSTNPLDTEILNSVLLGNLSLLTPRIGEALPCSDVLIKYLLLNVITSREELSGNIEYIEALSDYTAKYKGIWDNSLRIMLYQIAFPQLSGKTTDFNGFVDNDLETLLNRNKIKVKYTVTYDANGGVSAPSMQYKYWNIPLIITSDVPRLTGHIFAGWTADSEKTNPLSDRIMYKPNDTIERNANMTLYAMWE